MKVLSVKKLAIPVAAILVAAVSAGFLFFGPSEVTAQRELFENKDIVITHNARYIEGILATGAQDNIRQVHAFPESSVFLVRTRYAVTVWERRDRSVNKLLEINLDDDFEEVVFLDDDRTFIIRTEKSVKVYSVDRKITDMSTGEVTASR